MFALRKLFSFLAIIAYTLTIELVCFTSYIVWRHWRPLCHNNRSSSCSNGTEEDYFLCISLPLNCAQGLFFVCCNTLLLVVNSTGWSADDQVPWVGRSAVSCSSAWWSGSVILVDFRNACTKSFVRAWCRCLAMNPWIEQLGSVGSNWLVSTTTTLSPAGSNILPLSDFILRESE